MSVYDVCIAQRYRDCQVKGELEGNTYKWEERARYRDTGASLTLHFLSVWVFLLTLDIPVLLRRMPCVNQYTVCGCFIYAGLKLLRTVASYLEMVWPKFCGRKHAAGRGSWACSPRKRNVIRSSKIASATLIFLMLLLLFVLFFSGGPKIPVILGK